jgi:hypothetical protein
MLNSNIKHNFNLDTCLLTLLVLRCITTKHGIIDLQFRSIFLLSDNVKPEVAQIDLDFLSCPFNRLKQGRTETCKGVNLWNAE